MCWQDPVIIDSTGTYSRLQPPHDRPQHHGPPLHHEAGLEQRGHRGGEHLHKNIKQTVYSWRHCAEDTGSSSKVRKYLIMKSRKIFDHE